MAIFGDVELLTICICIFMLGHWLKHRNSAITYWPILGMVPGLVGNLSRIHDYVTMALKNSGGTFKFKGPWFSKMDFMVTCDPRNVNHVLSKNFHNYKKGDDFKCIFEPLGDGILNADSDSWRTQRTMLRSLIKQTKFQDFFHTNFSRKVKSNLIPVLDHVSTHGTEVDMQDVFQRFTFDLACSYVLGLDSNCLSIDFPNVPHEKAFDVMEEHMVYRHSVPKSLWKMQNWLNIGREKKFKKAWNTFDTFLNQCISKKQQEYSQGKIMSEEIKDKHEGVDITRGFMEEGDIGRHAKFLRDNAFNLLAAGRDTVSIALSWVLWLVATNPCVENKILQELEKCNPEKEDGKVRIFEKEDTHKLVYLHGVMCETLRLYPPVGFNHKCSIESDVLPSGDIIKSDTRILISMYAMGRMEEIWGKDCSEFKPERWISKEGGSKHEPAYKFIAFNAGPRSCLGKDMTLIQMKTITATIIWNYKVKLAQPFNASPCCSILLPIKHGLKVIITNRSSATNNNNNNIM